MILLKVQVGKLLLMDLLVQNTEKSQEVHVKLMLLISNTKSGEEPDVLLMLPQVLTGNNSVDN